MSDLSAAAEAIVLNTLLDGRFVSLHSASPGVTGANELSGSGYARQAVTFTLSGGNPTVASNSGIVEFPQATADWDLPTFYGIWDSASGGTFLGGKSIDDPRPINNGDVLRFLVGNLKVEAN